MIIQAKKVTKKFHNFYALKDLSLDIKRGEVFGLLGPNGAGKSTFISMIYGQVIRTEGEINVFDLDPSFESSKIKRRMGVVTQENALDESLTVFENMFVYAAFVGIQKNQREKKILSLLEYLNLVHKKDNPIRTLSGGMKRRLVFVRALLNDPEILILDEPTTGLDPAVRHLLWAKVLELKQKNITILLTTHYMHEAEVLCDRIVILDKGVIKAQGSPKDLIAEHTPGFVGIFDNKDLEKIRSVTQKMKYAVLQDDKTSVNLRVSNLDDLRTFYADHQIQPLQIRPANLEDVFLKLTGEELGIHD